jgi:hypothetical protein
MGCVNSTNMKGSGPEFDSVVTTASSTGNARIIVIILVVIIIIMTFLCRLESELGHAREA